ncbi:MAG: CarD family transcriptional regulator [Xanthobacteraceae bacterium]
MGSHGKILNRGASVCRAQAVSQKTRKKSISKGAGKTAAVTRSTPKNHARGSAKTARGSVKSSSAKTSSVKTSSVKTSTAKSAAVKPSTAKLSGAKSSTAKPSAAKSSKNKRSEMLKKTAKAAEKAVASKPATVKAAAPKPAASKPSPKAPAKPVAAKPSPSKPAVAAKVVKAPAAPVRVEEPKKALTQRQGFKTNEFVVYPAHGVGQILAIEEQEIAGAKLELFVINFMKDKMTLRVPTAKVANVGMRKLSEPALVKRALETLKGRARVKRTMWSRRAQEYEAKINSGDIVAIAEVVRDLYRSESQPEQSYSERQLYEAALDRLAREIAVVQHVTETEAVKEIEGQLAKSPRRGAKAETEGDADGDSDADAEDDDSAVTDAAA